MPTFPVPNWTHAGYHHNSAGGARYFGAHRSGRLHAACDLLAPPGSPIYAVADGVVREDPRGFYLHTNQLVIVHHGYEGYVLRYGEISPQTVPGIRRGTRVKEGDLIARVGQLRDNRGRTHGSMLHLEMYRPEAAAAGVSLTVQTREGGLYQRSRFLIDPTAHIDSWLARRPIVGDSQRQPAPRAPAPPQRPQAPAPPHHAAAPAPHAAPPAPHIAPPAAPHPAPAAAAPHPAAPAAPAARPAPAGAHVGDMAQPDAPQYGEGEHFGMGDAHGPVRTYFFLGH